VAHANASRIAALIAELSRRQNSAIEIHFGA
jgi:hypothetical protein